MLLACAREVQAIRVRIITTGAGHGGGVAILGRILVRTLAGAWEFGDPATADSAASTENSPVSIVD
jgi:hypothetical protein